MKVSTGPDIRYGCEMSDGKKFNGSLRAVAKNAALYTHRNGAQVIDWIAPGRTQTTRRQRQKTLRSKYTEEFDRL